MPLIQKNILFSFLMLMTGLPVLAQNTGTTAPPPASAGIRDTVKKKNGTVKIRMVEGAAMSAANDVIQNISAAKSFSIFNNAIKAAELEQTFKTTGPITVFVPLNSAFQKLPAGKIDSLLDPKNKIYLINLISYHAVSGKISSKDIGKQIKSGNGQAILITIAGAKLTARLNENRNIVLTDENGGQSIVSTFDVEQSNGLLHVINAVLIPKNKL